MGVKLERILVLCTGNICRSPMAEALLARALNANSQARVVESAGIGALVDYPADPLANTLMAERGIDLSAHRARQLTGALALRFDLLLVMDTEQRERVEQHWPLLRGRVYELGCWSGFDVDDPYRKSRAEFEASLTLIEKGIDEWLPTLCD